MSPMRAILRSGRADLRPERADLRPERADLRPERADLRPDRADLRPRMASGGGDGKWRDGETERRRNGETKLPYVES